MWLLIPALLVTTALLRTLLREVRSRAARIAPDSHAAAIFSDGMLPLLALIPFMGLALRADRSDFAATGSAAPLLIAGPIATAAIITGISFLLRPPRSILTIPIAAVIWLACGLILILLSAIGILSLMVGQTLLAMAVILYWVLAGPVPSAADTATAAAHRDLPRPSTTVLLFILALISALIIAIIPPPWHLIAILMHLLALVVFFTSLLPLSRSPHDALQHPGVAEASAIITLRAVGWVAATAPLLGLGLISITNFILHRTTLFEFMLTPGSTEQPATQPPRHPAFYAPSPADLLDRVAIGLHTLALPASTLTLLALFTILNRAMPTILQRFSGLILAILGLVLILNTITAAAVG